MELSLFHGWNPPRAKALRDSLEPNTRILVEQSLDSWINLYLGSV